LVTYIVTGNIDGQGLSGAYSQFITNGVPLYTFNVPNYAGLDANGFGIYPQGIDVSSRYKEARTLNLQQA
jgi:hypothetical protein